MPTRRPFPLDITMLAAMSWLTILVFSVSANPDYAEETGQTCTLCHINDEGDELTPTGEAFSGSGYIWPPTARYRPLGPVRRSVRYFVGFFHISAAFFWFGTILYVHIMLRPGYAAKGLPRGELILGATTMIVVGVTGVLLTSSRITSLSVMFDSRWGRLLLLKIAIYLIMISSAAVVVIFLRPRLGGLRKQSIQLPKGVFNADTLSPFNGKDGQRACLAYKGTVYDATNSTFWAEGSHMRHSAGEDLTSALARAPHGEDKLDSLPKVGTFDATHQPAKTTPQKIFYLIAYMNLILVFAVLFVIAYWRWGI